MSGKVVTWAFEQKVGSPAAKLVLVKLADNANDNGFCWVGPERIIEDSELSQSAVYKHLAGLQAAGLIRSFETTHPELGYPIRAFQLAVPEAWQAIPPRGKGKGKIPPGGKTIPPGGKGIPQGGKTIPPGGIHIEEPSSEPSSEEDAAPPPGGGGDLFGDPPPPPAALTKAEVLDLAFTAYDEAAARLEWQACQSRNETRAKKLAVRLDESGGIEGWRAALEKAEASDFCMGRAPPRPGKPPFRMHLDFLLQQQSFVRLMEGHYDNREGTGVPTGGGSFLEAAGRVASRDLTGGPN
jgi:hypothetical protein